MATRPKAISVSADDSVTLSAEEFAELSASANNVATIPEEIDETSADRVARMLRGAQDDSRAVLKMYKIESGGKRGWCIDYTPDEFESGGLAMIREQFGAGDYELRLYGVNGAGSPFGLRAREMVSVKSGPATAVNPATSQNSELKDVLRAMMEMQQRTFEAINNRPAVDPMAQMTQMLTMMKLMREGMGLDSQPKNGLSEQLALIRELKGVAQEFGDAPPPPEPSLTSMLPGVLELVGKGMQQNQQRGFPQSMPLVAQPLPAPVPIAPIAAAPTREWINPVPPSPESVPAPDPSNPDPQAVMQELMQKFRELVEMAEQKAPIEDGANLVFEFLPDEVIAVLRQEDWFKLLSQFEPAMSTHQAWLTEVRTLALEWFDEPDEDDPLDDSKARGPAIAED